MVHKKNLKDFWSNYNEQDEDVGLSEDDLAYNRIARKISFTSPKHKNITGLIKKALSLVKKVEEIDKRKKSLESTISSSKSTPPRESSRSSEREERIRDEKEEKRFSDLKEFIQDQQSISSLIKEETAGIKELFTSRNREQRPKEETGDTLIGYYLHCNPSSMS